MVGDKSLKKLLEEYSEKDIYPFHMPGHKRRVNLPGSSKTDITEIDGFDDLHHATDVLLAAQKRAAEVRGAREAFFLVNGSSGGILASVFASCRQGETIAIARNCHRSVYHAAMIRGLKTVYFYPSQTAAGINGSADPEEIERLLKENPHIKAVILTSPTYDGVVSDIAGISKTVHKAGAVLIVDAAHGAHLGLSERLPGAAIKQGADYVIESVHKTLPSYTQTALLLSNCTDNAAIRKYLRIFMTSSPSYIFMASIDECMDYIKTRGRADMEKLLDNIENFLDKTRNLKKLRVVRKEDLNNVFDYDITKILISTCEADINGVELGSILLEKYGIQTEMSAGEYVIALTSVMDEETGFDRLQRALKEIDEEAAPCNKERSGQVSRPRKICEMYEADGQSRKEVRIEDAANEVSAEFVYMYPPGIPVIVPGELIEPETVETITKSKETGLELQGTDDINTEYIQVL